MSAVDLTPTNVLGEVRTRSALRAFVVQELPGWEPWLTLAAAEVQRDAWDHHLLKTERELLEDIRTFAAEFVEFFSADEKERYFLPFMQHRPDYPLAQDLPAAEPATTTRDGLPFSYANLAGRMPSRALIGLIGALGLRQQRFASEKHLRGRSKNQRLATALSLVTQALVPFVKTQAFTGNRSVELVEPEPEHRHGTYQSGACRRGPLTMSLVAVVAIYLSLPNRQDPDAGTDPERLELSPSLLDDTVKRLRAMARDFEDERVAREQLETIQLDDSTEGKTESQFSPVTKLPRT